MPNAKSQPQQSTAPGKPRKLTRETHDTIMRYLRAGAFMVHAAEAADVSFECVRGWLKRGKAGEKRYVQFYEDVRRERARDAIRSQSIITRAEIAGDWKAAAWSLERKYPQQYGTAAATARVTINHPGADDDAGGTDGGSTGPRKTQVEFYLPSNQRRPGEQSDPEDDGDPR